MAESGVSILNPVRSLETFGVAGLLGDDCRVFYETLFSTSSIGRVSDVVVNQLRGNRPDEFRIRLVLLHSCFEAFRSMIEEVPVQFECGVDPTRLAIGVSFKVMDGLTVEWKGLEARVGAGKPANRFESTLHQVGKVSDALVVRFEPTTKQIEIVSILDLKAASRPSTGEKRVEFLFVEIKQEREVPKAAQYIELGDTAYDILEKRPGPQSQQEEEFRRTLAGMNEAATRTKVKGSKEGEGNNVVRLAGGETAEEGPALQRVTGGVKKLFKGLFGKAEVVAGDPASQDGGEPIRIEADAPTENASEAEMRRILGDKPAETDQSNVTVIEGQAAPTSGESLDQVVNTMDALSAGSDKLEKVSDEIRKELKSDTAKRLFDQTVAAVIAERSKIKEMSRKMTSMVRQKEIEAQSKENTFKEGLREKNDQLRQRDSMITRLREQMQQASAEMERLKQQSIRRADTNPVMKQKLTQIQGELNISRETNTKLTAKIEELKTKINSERVSRNNEKNSESTHAQELLVARQQYERASRLSEELKKDKQRLMERVDQLTKKTTLGASGDQDAKIKLVNAGKMLAATKKDNEKLNTVIMQMKADELKMKGEMNQINKELVRAKSLLSQARAATAAAAPPTEAAKDSKDAKDPKKGNKAA